METILAFLEEYSNVPMVIFTALTTLATFLIWWVTRNQAEISGKQTEYAYLMAKAAEQPIIQTSYIIDNLHNYMLRKSNTVYVDNDKILVIQMKNIGKGAAYNLKIEQRGRKTKEIDILPVGQNHEYFVLAKDIRSEEISPTVKVTYQDIFENEFTIED